MAVLLVVAFHVGLAPWSGGYIGVDVFFVLSGYLITGLLVREVETRGRVDFLAFYARRARRLLPAAVLMLVVTSLASYVVYSPVEQSGLHRVRLATALYASNIAFIRSSADYFAAETAGDPLLHTWSLSVEEQFYLAWPLLVGLTYRARNRRVLGGTLAIVSVVSVVACVWLTAVRQPWAFFGTPFRAWEFGVGGLAALIPFAGGWSRTARLVIGWATLLIIVGFGAIATDRIAFPGIVAVLPAIATALLLAIGRAEQGAAVQASAPSVLSTRPMQFLGRHSYSWYLWHWPVLVLAAELMPGLGITGRVACGVLALGLAMVSYRFVEQPIRFHIALQRNPWRSIALGGALTVVSVSVALGVYRAGVSPTDLRQQAYLAAVADGSPVDQACTSQLTSSALRECSFGADAAATTVALFGDSHAAQWFPALEQLAADSSWRIVTLLKAGCPAASVAVFNARLGKEYADCAAWRMQALQRLAELQPDAVVVASQSWYAESAAADRLTEDAWRVGFSSMLQPLHAAGIGVVILRDTPRFPYRAPVCLSRAVRRESSMLAGAPPDADCAEPESTALDTRAFAGAQSAAAVSPGAQLVDFSNAFCRGGLCFTALDGRPLYRDAHHITASYARALAPRLAPGVSAAIRGHTATAE